MMPHSHQCETRPETSERYSEALERAMREHGESGVREIESIERKV